MENDKEDVKKSRKIIGKYSFGIALIFFGLSIFFGTILKFDILRYVLMLWPLIFVALGIEVIHFSKKDDNIISYSYSSIFMIFVLVIVASIFSIFNYGVNKVLYNEDVKSYIVSEIEENQIKLSYNPSKKLHVLNNSGKKINVKYINSKQSETRDTAILTANYNSNFSENVFGMYFQKNLLDKKVDYSSNTQTLSINDMSKYIDSLDLVVYTTDQNSVIIQDY